jgi:hypothetical protein
MKKIPTLFRRDPDNMARVLPELNPGCEWVLHGEGTPTRKYDGTCVLITAEDGDIRAYGRREVKPGKPTPDGFIEVDHDPVTGKRVGWVRASLGDKANRWLAEALGDLPFTPGTYELCGPRINGNPEGFDHHVLIPHGRDQIPFAPLPHNPAAAHTQLELELRAIPIEGIVWHHPDGRMAKLKRRDYGISRGRGAATLTPQELHRLAERAAADRTPEGRVVHPSELDPDV